MLAGLRFRLYRWLLGSVTARGFRRQRVLPLELPAADHIEVEPLGPELPRLFGARNFPSTEHAGERMRGIRLRALLLPFVQRIPAATTAPVATDQAGLLEQIYPKRYRQIWAQPPVVPPELEADDVLAALAVGGPFAMYLQRGSTLRDDVEPDSHGVGADEAGADEADADEFVIDMRFFDAYAPKPGLVAPGGRAVFDVVDGHLRTRAIVHEGRLHAPGDESFDRAHRALLCALNTHLTTFVHNVTIHLGYITPMAVAATNELSPDHPIRRLLHPAFHTTLVGNHEIARFQIVGERSFATSLFSHDQPTLMRMIGEHLASFRIADLDPEDAFARRGLRDAGIELPFWDDSLALWRINLDYVERYVSRYFADDEAVASDPQLRAWTAELDRLLPSGLPDDHGYLSVGEPLSRAMLTRVCATLLHTSSATHDAVNNAVWDYSTPSYVVPTVVPQSLEPQDVRLSFDLLNTIIGTWKPYNMLIDGVSVLALDDEGRAIMDDYVEALRERQLVMDTEPRRPGRTYPDALNPSVSN
jgi:Lipoxygenase